MSGIRMWAQVLRATRRPISSRPRLFVQSPRKYNDGPHTTYFQQPPPQKSPSTGRRILGRILWTSLGFTLGASAILYLDADLIYIEQDLAGDHTRIDENLGFAELSARKAPPLSSQAADASLMSRSEYIIAPKVFAHVAQMPSNIPCEDTISSATYTFSPDSRNNWCEFGIYDGHAGPRCAEVLRSVLPPLVGSDLFRAKCLDRPYFPNDPHIVRTIQETFLQVDRDLTEGASKLFDSTTPLALRVSAAAPAFSGSCALLALWDPVQCVLRVANVGDSRAVLGRWDGDRYVAKPMSVDQTGFNPEEVARIERNHPGEDVIDPKTGRVHGIAVSRAFGDSRWKWSEEITQKAYEMLWGPTPRPAGLIKTPPYLSAEPEVTDTKIKTTGRPDFLIMASDGLWDHMSSEDAVACVEMWLQKNKPTDLLENPERMNIQEITDYSPPFDVSGDDDTFYSKEEQCLQWRVSPKHFTVFDAHCGAHLIKNALGGKRENLYTGVMTLQPPLSRKVRDDITVQVIFFGIDDAAAEEMARKSEEKLAAAGFFSPTR